MSNEDVNVDSDCCSDDYDFDVDIENVDVENDDIGFDDSDQASKEKSPKKKQHHNDLEQRRRKDLGQSFTRLQGLVRDEHPSDKVGRDDCMQHAALLICNLTSHNEQMQKDMADLAQLNAMMRKKVEALQKEGKIPEGATGSTISITNCSSSSKKRKKTVH